MPNIRCNLKVDIVCKKHGIFKQRPSNHTNGQGCPKCKQSKAVIEIHNLFKSIKENYIPEHYFPDLMTKFNRPLYFDFFLPNRNICLEYDGEQHFRSVSFFGGEEGLKLRKEYDQMKNEYCKRNRIILIRISYKFYHKLTSILNDILSGKYKETTFIY